VEEASLEDKRALEDPFLVQPKLFNIPLLNRCNLPPFGIQTVAQSNVSVFGPPRPQTPSTQGFTEPSSNMGVSTMDVGKISAPAGIGAFVATPGSFGL
jgi:hypothetical protein